MKLKEAWCTLWFWFQLVIFYFDSISCKIMRSILHIFEPMVAIKFFWWLIFFIFVKTILIKEYSVKKFPVLKRNKFAIIKHFISRIATIPYNTKGCLRISIFIFWILPNLAKYAYGSLQVEQHHKMELKNIACCGFFFKIHALSFHLGNNH